jgi:glycosyltransferase involved in cell wall biosynthesis
VKTVPTPLVSILIPAYNAEAWIGDTLRSALAQTWPNTEIIVVDDGSRDETVRVARQFESAKLRVIPRMNQGAAATRNFAFSLSRGEYIQYLDADDLLDPNKISEQMRAIPQERGSRTLLSCAWGPFLHAYHRTRFVPTPLWCDLSPVDWLARKLEFNAHMQTATWLTSRELAEAAGPWDTTQLSDDDGEYFCRVILQSDGIKFVDTARVYYRTAGASSLSYIGASSRKIEAMWASMQLHVRYIRSLEDSPRTRKACLAYLQHWLLNFYPDRLDIVEQARSLAHSLGGELNVPRLSWKYSWIINLAGWHAAKQSQRLLANIRLSLYRSYDKALFQIQSRRLPHLWEK